MANQPKKVTTVTAPAKNPATRVVAPGKNTTPLKPVQRGTEPLTPGGVPEPVRVMPTSDKAARSNSGLMLDKALISEIKRVSAAQGISMRAWGHKVLWAAVQAYDARHAELAAQVEAAQEVPQEPVQEEQADVSTASN